MNLYLKICQIEDKIRNSNITCDYFVESFKVLNFFIYFERYNEAFSFANALGNAKVLTKSDNEKIRYLLYCIKLEDIIKELETKLKVKSIKVR